MNKNKNRYNTVLCSVAALTANVTQERDSFPSYDKLIFVLPLQCPYKDNTEACVTQGGPVGRTTSLLHIPEEENGN